MSVITLRGVIPAHLTPFHPDGSIDEQALRQHVAHLAQEHGVTTLMSNGHAGQAGALTCDERRRVLALVLESCGDTCPVLAGLVAEDEDAGVALATAARDEGASGLVVFPLPHWRDEPQRERELHLLRYLDRLHAETGLPLVIYQQRVEGGSGYDSTTLLRACRHPAVVAVKEGSGSVPLYEQHVRALARLPRPVPVLTTHSTWLLSALVVGGDGILSGMSSVTAALHAALLDALERSHLPGARAINDRLWPLTQLFYATPGLDPHTLMKAALQRIGLLPSAAVRPPLAAPSAKQIAQVEHALVQARLLKK